MTEHERTQRDVRRCGYFLISITLGWIVGAVFPLALGGLAPYLWAYTGAAVLGPIAVVGLGSAGDRYGPAFHAWSQRHPMHWL